MTRDELAKFIEGEAQATVRLFREKNKSYGNDEDGFFNFHGAAKDVWHDVSLRTMFRVLLTHVHKHFSALCNNGLDDPEVEQRLRDMAVYSYIGLAMVEEARKRGEAV